MAKKRKAVAPPQQVEERRKLKVVAEPESSSSEEDEDPEVEEEDPESEEEEESEDSSEEEEDEEEEEESENESESDEEEEFNSETLRTLLQPFEKDQIMSFLKDAALKNPSIITRIREMSESDPAQRKIFVHGLSWDTTTEQVVDVFKQYGEIEECRVVTDKVTGRAKGYAFVLFKTGRGTQKALKERQKKIGNRMTTSQLAAAGPPPSQTTPAPETTGRKLYVASVGPNLNPEKLRTFFTKFGEIDESHVPYDQDTGKLKGYAIFVYKTPEGCKKALEEPSKVFEGFKLQCRPGNEGNRANANQTGLVGPPGEGIQQPTGVSTMNYAMGMSPGILNVNPAAAAAMGMMGQNPWMGMANPMLASAFAQTGMHPLGVNAYSHSIGASPAAMGLGGNYGVNTISPSVIGIYGSQAALQGQGAYNSAQVRKSSAETGTAAGNPHYSFGSTGNNFPSFGR